MESVWDHLYPPLALAVTKAKPASVQAEEITGKGSIFLMNAWTAKK
jgi:hypothetical protein